MTSGRVRTAFVVAAVSCFAAPALAEPTAEDLASARQLYKEGRALREQGDLPKALEKLRAAHALGQTPITGIELARTYVLVGRLVYAREVSLGVARLPVASDETERSATARVEAAKLATELEPRLATLLVGVRGLPPGASPSLTVDGEAIPADAVGEPRRADPGKHVAVLVLPSGVSVRAETELKEGESRALVIDASTLAAAPAPAPTPPVPPTTEAPPPRARSQAVLITSGVVALVGAVSTVYYGVLALNAKGGLTADCPGGQCGPSHHSELDTARTNGNIATGAFVVTGAALGVMVLDIVLHAKKPAQAGVVPEVGVGWVGAHATF